MSSVGRTWAVVLAAGEGSRLREWTMTCSGVSVPKQFCSLRGGVSLMEHALQRANGVATREHVCVVVAAQHRMWWETPLKSLPASNIIVQPQNRGTGIGMLLALVRILRRDPEATIVWLPSDHHIQQEDVLASSMRAAVTEVERDPRRCILLGVEPDEADPELGYIVPSDHGANNVYSIGRFVEKPRREVAQLLIERGALWNVFIVASRAAKLLGLFEKRAPGVVHLMQSILCARGAHSTDPSAISTLYAQLPSMDFSRHVTSGTESDLSVMPVPPCGWTDLGTPTRLVATLRRLPAVEHMETAELVPRPPIDLSSQRHIF